MGVKKYYNRWRSYVVDLQGNHHQEYFDTEKEAQDHFDKVNGGKVGRRRYKRRSNANNPELPVGIFVNKERKLNTHGIRVTREYYKAVFFFMGKSKSKQKRKLDTVEDQRTIADLVKWRNEMMKEKL